jgi:hypothetical protein
LPFDREGNAIAWIKVPVGAADAAIRRAGAGFKPGFKRV